MSVRSVVLSFVVLAGPAVAQDAVGGLRRVATEQDAKLLSTKDPVFKGELARIGLRQAVGKACTAFVTADSVRLIQTPLPLDKTTVTVPYASFLIWSADRPFADSVLYHMFAGADAAYTKPEPAPPNTASDQSVMVVLAKREPYPSAEQVARDRQLLSSGPFTAAGARDGARSFSLKPYVLPTQNDDPASVLPRKDEHTLQVTCLSDPDRVTNCLCVGTD